MSVLLCLEERERESPTFAAMVSSKNSEPAVFVLAGEAKNKAEK